MSDMLQFVVSLSKVTTDDTETTVFDPAHLCNKRSTSWFLDKIHTPTAFANFSPGLALKPWVTEHLCVATLKGFATLLSSTTEANPFRVSVNWAVF